MNILKCANIRISSRNFVVSQGEIEKISNLKPMDKRKVGLLEYIENAIGNSYLITKLEFLNITLCFLFYQLVTKSLKSTIALNDSSYLYTDVHICFSILFIISSYFSRI